MFGTLLDSALVVSLNQFVWWSICATLGDNTFAGMGWASGMIGVAAVGLHHHRNALTMMLFGVTLVWGLRMMTLIFARRLRDGAEDWRYATLRQKWGGQRGPLMSLFGIFIPEGLALFGISFLLQWAAFARLGSSLPFLLFGGAVAMFGLALETAADWQLFQFKSNAANRDRTLSTGLWQLSRHPNYLGEMLVWWGMFLCTLPSMRSWFAVGSPLLLTLLLVGVSGIPLLEAKLGLRADYQAYQDRVSALIPGIGFALPRGGELSFNPFETFLNLTSKPERASKHLPAGRERSELSAKAVREDNTSRPDASTATPPRADVSELRRRGVGGEEGKRVGSSATASSA